MAGIRTLKERRKFQALVLIYKCIHKDAPRYIEEFSNIKACNCNLRGSGTRLMLPNFNLEWRYKTFAFLALKLWNLLPSYVRKTPRTLLLLNVF